MSTTDTDELRVEIVRGGRPPEVGEARWMDGMNVVGDLAGANVSPRSPCRPQSEGRSHLRPRFIEGGAWRSLVRGRVRLDGTTARGGVHDIGKEHHAAVRPTCNNHDVHDLGVMVPAQRSSTPPRDLGADAIGSVPDSCTPSLDDGQCRGRDGAPGLRDPLLIGGRRHASAPPP